MNHIQLITTSKFDELILRKIDDPVIDQIASKVYWYRGDLVGKAKDGVKQVTKRPTNVFVQEQLANELEIDRNCSLTHIVAEPKSELNQFDYVIAVSRPKDNESAASTQLVEIFNNAIRELKRTGKMDELKRKYWNRNCNQQVKDSSINSELVASQEATVKSTE